MENIKLPRDPRRRAIYNQLNSLFHDPKRHALRFPTSLSSAERRLVHQYAEALNFVHVTLPVSQLSGEKQKLDIARLPQGTPIPRPTSGGPPGRRRIQPSGSRQRKQQRKRQQAQSLADDRFVLVYKRGSMVAQRGRNKSKSRSGLHDDIRQQQQQQQQQQHPQQQQPLPRAHTVHDDINNLPQSPDPRTVHPPPHSFMEVAARQLPELVPGGAGPRRTNSVDEGRLEQMFTEFLQSPQRVLRLPTYLTSGQRKLAHLVADRLGLDHDSCGRDQNRFVRITKRDPKMLARQMEWADGLRGALAEHREEVRARSRIDYKLKQLHDQRHASIAKKPAPVGLQQETVLEEVEETNDRDDGDDDENENNAERNMYEEEEQEDEANNDDDDDDDDDGDNDNGPVVPDLQEISLRASMDLQRALMLADLAEPVQTTGVGAAKPTKSAPTVEQDVKNLIEHGQNHHHHHHPHPRHHHKPGDQSNIDGQQRNDAKGKADDDQWHTKSSETAVLHDDDDDDDLAHISHSNSSSSSSSSSSRSTSVDLPLPKAPELVDVVAQSPQQPLDGDTDNMPKLRLMSWNIEWMDSFFASDTEFHESSRGVDSVSQLCESIGSVIDELDPDALFVQEGPSRLARMELFNRQFLGDQFEVFGQLDDAQRMSQQLYILVRRDGPLIGARVDDSLDEFFTEPFYCDVRGDLTLRPTHFIRRPLPLVARFRAAPHRKIHLINLHLKSKGVQKGREMWESGESGRRQYLAKAVGARRQMLAECLRVRQCLNSLVYGRRTHADSGWHLGGLAPVAPADAAAAASENADGGGDAIPTATPTATPTDTATATDSSSDRTVSLSSAAAASAAVAARLPSRRVLGSAASSKTTGPFIVVAGDLNDGPGLDFVETYFLIGNPPDVLLGSPFSKTRLLTPLLVRSSLIPPQEQWTIEYSDFIDDVLDRRVLLDHFFVSQPLWRTVVSANVEHDVYNSALRGDVPAFWRGSRPSDHRPITAEFLIPQ